ncbi:hypothetical protein EJ04DRAFT_547941 [Polyplosphaeria fusca]|uniref:Uncharacterized protein n=1 Tax=Polyplosphaeria fusca TaxID=682080 RepID=A0A9P4R8G9_9PLEO|nr:hypothetical protein EJ04DRAFT_547941 [Polyplosphaeria fusca]
MIVPAKAAAFAILFTNKALSVYGIVIELRETCSICSEGEAISTLTPNLTSVASSSTFISSRPTTFDSSYGSASSNTYISSAGSISTNIAGVSLTDSSSSEATSPLSTPSTQQPKGMRPEVKLGIALTIVFLVLLLLVIVIFNALIIRRRRREKDVQHALNEVEENTAKESQERVVLESRVSIVFVDDDTEGEEEEEEEEEERGRARNGMSLPRRDH